MDSHPPSQGLRIYRPSRSRAVLLTSYMTGATAGVNLGTAGYSYDFVAKIFQPLLERWGEVIPVAAPRQNLERVAKETRDRGLEPVHVAFLPMQDAYLSPSVPNVVVPAWEFPEVPDHPFDGNLQNDWPATANACAAVLVGGPFTVNAFRRAGAKGPIHVVPVPVSQAKFDLPAWEPAQRQVLECRAVVFNGGAPSPQPQILPFPDDPEIEKPPPRGLKGLGKSLERQIRTATRRLLGGGLYARLVHPLERRWHAARRPYHGPPSAGQIGEMTRVDLSGVVYTSIFNPRDGRKNWQDLLTGFLYALGDRADATLVLKLITSDPRAVDLLVNYYRNRDIPHRCKVVIITDYLSHEQMQCLAQASTYYYQTTRAEGNCLPLMDYLAAGRPGVSPLHSAIGDYFDRSLGFVVESHPEPCAWPHDRRLRLRATWGRIVWPDLVRQLRQSYQVATENLVAYRAMAERARERMAQWASIEIVWRRLERALDEVANPLAQTDASMDERRKAI